MTPSLARILGRSQPRHEQAHPVVLACPSSSATSASSGGACASTTSGTWTSSGEDGVAADAEVLAVAIDGLRELGLADRGLPRAGLRSPAAHRGPAGRGRCRRTGSRRVRRSWTRSNDSPRDRALAAPGETRQGCRTRRAAELLEVLDYGPRARSPSASRDREDVGPALERLDEYLGVLRGPRPRRLRAGRPDDRARAWPTTRASSSSSSTRRVSCAPSAGAGATTGCSSWWAASPCRRSASAWVTSCSRELLPDRGLRAGHRAVRRLLPRGRSATDSGPRRSASPSASGRGTHRVAYALRAQARAASSSRRRRRRGPARRSCSARTRRRAGRGRAPGHGDGTERRVALADLA